ncbi:MAG: dihydropteroate synthase [bacterium]
MNKHAVYLSLGSNMGNRLGYIHEALRHLKQGMIVDQVSFLYQTDPVGFTDQDAFLNCVCKCSTDKQPNELLKLLEMIMATMGRVRAIKWGPRIIDIDILLYDDLVVTTELLTIPHPRMHERAFVLEPLCDINSVMIHPGYGKTVRELLDSLNELPLQKVSQIGNKIFEWGKRTHVLGIVNATPDSFSGDGIMHKTEDEWVQGAQQLVLDGADCLDIGAMSTRPGHDLISEDEELRRLIPVLRAIRPHVTTPISVDTFRPSVARAAINAGADMINSIWGAEYDPGILDVVIEKEVALVLTVNRSVTDYYSSEKTLMQMIQDAQTAGIYPWNIIVDPGIGFVQHTEDNYEIIKNIPAIAAYGYPVLVGASRKKFIRQIAGTTDNNALVIPNVVAHVIMARAGATMVRVHDVAAVVDGLRISDTLGI